MHLCDYPIILRTGDAANRFQSGGLKACALSPSFPALYTVPFLHHLGSYRIQQIFRATNCSTRATRDICGHFPLPSLFPRLLPIRNVCDYCVVAVVRECILTDSIQRNIFKSAGKVGKQSVHLPACPVGAT